MPTTGGRAATSPLIHNGIMYLVSPNDVIVAVDARSGSRVWEYRRSLPQIGAEPGMIHHRYSGAKRGLALYGDKIFTVTSDNAVVAARRPNRQDCVGNISRRRRLRGEHQRADHCRRHSDRRRQLPERRLSAATSPATTSRPARSCGAMRSSRVRMGRATRHGAGRRSRIVGAPVSGARSSTTRCRTSCTTARAAPVRRRIYQRGVAGKNATLARDQHPLGGATDNRRNRVAPPTPSAGQLGPGMYVRNDAVDTPMHPNPSAEGMLAANPNVSETMCALWSACRAKTLCSGRSSRKPASSFTPGKPLGRAEPLPQHRREYRPRVHEPGSWCMTVPTNEGPVLHLPFWWTRRACRSRLRPEPQHHDPSDRQHMYHRNRPG